MTKLRLIQLSTNHRFVGFYFTYLCCRIYAKKRNCLLEYLTIIGRGLSKISWFVSKKRSSTKYLIYLILNLLGVNRLRDLDGGGGHIYQIWKKLTNQTLCDNPVNYSIYFYVNNILLNHNLYIMYKKFLLHFIMHKLVRKFIDNIKDLFW